MDNGPPSTSINRIDQLSPIYLDSANEVNQGPPSTRHQLSSLTHSILLSPSPQSVSPFFSHSTSTRKTHSTSPTSYERGSSFTGSKQYENVEAIDSTATKSMVGLATSLVDSGDIVSAFHFIVVIIFSFFFFLAFVYFYVFDRFLIIKVNQC